MSLISRCRDEVCRKSKFARVTKQKHRSRERFHLFLRSSFHCINYDWGFADRSSFGILNSIRMDKLSIRDTNVEHDYV